MKRWMRVAMLLCSVVISVATAHAVQQGDGKAMLERLAAKTKKEVRLLERAEKKFAAEADVDGSRRDKLRQRTGKNSELMLEQLAGGRIRPTKSALGMGRLTGQKASCSEGLKNAEQDAGRIKEIRRELRQKKQLLRETEIKLARQNQADVSSKKARLRQKHPQSGQRVQSSQVVSAAEGETGSISGTVTDQDGNPVTGVYVFVYTSDYDYASYGWTDANGDYTVSGLASGSYKVEFD
uniref:carboxypeptidase-like regulatory domain-containing protein n=1 Tax=Candidatus Electronema sp. TaxID=2698783 RepID=UPI004055A461